MDEHSPIMPLASGALQKDDWYGSVNYQALFEQSGDCVFVIRPDFTILSMNAQAQKLLGYTNGQLPDTASLNLDDSYLREKVLAKKVNVIEHTLYRKDGSFLQVELSISHVCDAEDTLIYIQLVARDIAGRKQNERLLKRNVRAQSIIGEVTAVLFRSANIEGRLPEVLESLGCAVGVFSCVVFDARNSSLRIKYKWVDPTLPEFDASAVITPFLDSLSKFPDRVFSIPDMPEKMTGAPKVSMLAVPIQGALGAWGFLGLFYNDAQRSWLPTSFDIVQTTANLLGAAIERMHYEETLRLSERRNRIIVDAMPDLLIRVDRSGRIFDYNVGRSHPLYLEPGAAIGRNLNTLWGEEIANKILPRIPDETLFSMPKMIEKFQLPAITGEFEARLYPISKLEALVIVRDITEQVRLNRMKSDFLNWASHELRTPLTAAILMTDLLKLDCTPEERDEYLATLSGELSRQKELINELLMAGRLENGALKIEVTALSLIPVVEQAVSAVRPIAKKKQVAVNIKAVEVIQILGDAGALRQVFTNLLSNAVKFSPEGSEVRVEVDSCEGMARISISDHGLGIPADAIPHLFSRFFRARNVTAAEIPGSGIGLYIVKSILDELRGRIEVFSEVNKGTTFTVFLRLAD